MDITVTTREDVEMPIATIQELDAAIIELKAKKREQQQALAQQFKATYESFRPSNIIKSTIADFTQPGDGRSLLLKAVGGIGAGLLTKGILGGKAGTMIGGIAGRVLKSGAMNAFYSNADKLKAYGTAIYHNLFQKKKD